MDKSSPAGRPLHPARADATGGLSAGGEAGSQDLAAVVRAGEQAAAAGRPADAMLHFATAVALAPSNAGLHFALASTALDAGRQDVGNRHLREVVRLDPNNGPACRRLALVALADGDVETALACSTRAREMSPAGDVGADGIHATVLEAVGRADEAWDLASRVIAANWCSTHLAATYAKLAPRRGKGPMALTLLEQIMARPSTRPDYRLHLQFVAGELLERLGRYDEAFAYYLRANAGKGAAFDPAGHSRWVGEMIAAFSPDRWRSLPRAAQPTEQPVFILGMPRSGTSLVEQILASHPAVHAMGEVSFLVDALTMLGQLLPGPSGMADSLDRLRQSPAVVERLSAAYVGAMRATVPARPAWVAPIARVTNKTPLNFFHVPWVGLLTPRARVIHCVRDPLDTCLSCFTTHFGADQPYTYDLGHLGRFYRDYRRLMDHYRATLDVPTLDVRYEDVVADPAGQVGRLLDFVGLPWDDRCLRFYDNPRYVHTTSYDQVRRPVYASSVGRWRRFDRHLGPLRAGLGDVAAGSA